MTPAETGVAVKVLIVDDSKLARIVAGKALAELQPHWEKVEAGSAAQAHEVIVDTPIDVALIDYNMTEKDGLELADCRQRFLVECVAAGVVAVDCPYTWSDIEGVESEARRARRWGYVAKSLVDPAHAAVINTVMGPDEAEIHRARDIVTAFEAARAAGQARVELDGSLVEVPTYNTAKRLLARGEAMRDFQRIPSA